MKTTLHFLGLCLLTAVVPSPKLFAAPLLPPANVYYTSFEGAATPSYIEGQLAGQNGWAMKGSTLQTSSQVVLGGTAEYPSSPEGSQMVALRNTKNSSDVYGGSPKATVQFSSTPLTGMLYFSGVTGYSGVLSDKTGVISRFYLNDASNEFNGVIFGLQKSGDDVRFFYNNGLNAVSFGESVAAADTYYRFELDIDIAARRFDIRVYDYQTNALLGSAEHAAFRGDTATLSHLRMNNLSSFPNNGDDFATYYDEIWISTSAIPEPSSTALLLGACGASVGLAYRNRYSKLSSC